MGEAEREPGGLRRGARPACRIPAGWSFTSSGRLEGVPGRRASSAFDGRRSTAWIAPFVPHRRPWVAIRAPHPFTARRLTLAPGPHGYAVPVRLRVVASGGVGQDVSVGPRGVVDLPREVHTRALRVVVLARRARRARGQPRRRPSRSARSRCARTRSAASGCGRDLPSHCGALALRSGPSVATARVSGTIAALDAGRPLRLAGCGRRALLDLPSGASRVVVAPGVTLRADHLELDAPPPAPLPPPVAPGGGRPRRDGEGDGSHDHVRLRLDKPAWLVYGESY